MCLIFVSIFNPVLTDVPQIDRITFVLLTPLRLVINMRIRRIVWLDETVHKLWTKHQVTPDEVAEVLNASPDFYFVERGRRKGEDLYLAAGRTSARRPLVVYFIHKASRDALVVTARTMTRKERRRYEQT